MENLKNILQDYLPFILISMAVIIVLLFILVVVLFKAINKLENKYRRMMKGSSGKNIEQLIISQLDKIEDANKLAQEALNECETVQVKMKECVQKVAIMRYKAFEDVGSDLSFSVAILDDNNDGVMLTGIYSRQESITYAKPIDKGISRYDLSEEEIVVLNEAIKKGKTENEEEEKGVE